MTPHPSQPIGRVCQPAIATATTNKGPMTNETELLRRCLDYMTHDPSCDMSAMVYGGTGRPTDCRCGYLKNRDDLRTAIAASESANEFEQNLKLAKYLAKHIFECGDEPGVKITRIQFLSGEWPDAEKPEGGLTQDPLARAILAALMNGQKEGKKI